MDTAARTFPAVAGVVNGEAVAVGVVLVPLCNCHCSLLSPVVNVRAGADAHECFLAWILGNADSGPALLAELACDESFVLVESDYTERSVPFELVSFDGLAAPAFLKGV